MRHHQQNAVNHVPATMAAAAAWATGLLRKTNAVRQAATLGASIRMVRATLGVLATSAWMSG